LRVTASQAFGQTLLGPMLPKFSAMYPQLRVELISTDVNLDLVGERMDLAIRLGRATDSAIIGTKLFTTHYRVCAAPNYLKRGDTLRRPADLSRHECVLLNMLHFRDTWRFRASNGAEERVAVDGKLLTSSILTVREWARAGVGPALLPHWLIDADLRSGRLRNLFPRLQVTATDFDTGAWLLYPSRRYLPNKVRCMIDFLRQELARPI